MSRISQSDNVDHVHENNVYFPCRTLFAIGDIDSNMYNSLAKNLLVLDQSTGTINIRLFSEGGCVQSGWAIYDAIRECKNYVRICGYGEVSSMASVILQAADERLLSKNSCLMIHVGTRSMANHVENFERWNNYFNGIEKPRTEKVYLDKIKEKKPRFTKQRLQELLKFDTILTPTQALELGLIDKIGESR